MYRWSWRSSTRRLRKLGATRGVVLGLWVAVGLGLASDVVPRGVDVGAFASRPDLRPPELAVDTASRATSGSRQTYTFLAPWRGEGQAGPMIVDERGEMVWFHPLPAGREAMDFRAQRYDGRPVLTWWEGQVTEDGYGRGDYVIADRSYQEIARFRSGGGRPGDFHEYLITPRGTALITIYRPVRHDLSPVGGPSDGTVLESIVQEIDIDTGRVLLNWRALDHVSLQESHEAVPEEPDEIFDHFHVNAIDIDHDGNLLVSARHTDTVYKIHRRTGEVIWRLGGERSDFAFGPGARFFSQHDARRQPDGDITIFDNSNPPQVRERSRAIRLRLDPQAKTAHLERATSHPEELSSESQGNMQTLPGGDIVVGWGSQPYVSRFSERGDLRFDARFPDDTDVYRAYQSPWSGRPPGRPAVVVDDIGGDDVTVRASWNGATEVVRWEVLAGEQPDLLRPVESQQREGFETSVPVPTGHEYVAVRAVSESGEALGTSRAVPTSGPLS